MTYFSIYFHDMIWKKIAQLLMCVFLVRHHHSFSKLKTGDLLSRMLQCVRASERASAKTPRTLAVTPVHGLQRWRDERQRRSAAPARCLSPSEAPAAQLLQQTGWREVEFITRAECSLSHAPPPTPRTQPETTVISSITLLAISARSFCIW